MKPQEQGFTLIEVVLAIAVGLIIIAGVGVGYTYAKKAAIQDNQRKNVVAVKSFVEQAVTSNQANLAVGGSTLTPPVITNSQLASLAARLPSLNVDPYLGATRASSCTASQSCYAASPTAVTAANTAYGPKLTDGSVPDSFTPVTGGGSELIYVAATTFSKTFTVTLADGSAKTLYGYVVLESDIDGFIVAAEGGDSSLATSGG